MKKGKLLPVYIISYIAYFRVCLIFSWSTIHTETYTGEFRHVNDLLGNDSWVTNRRRSLGHCERVSIISIINSDTFIKGETK